MGWRVLAVCVLVLSGGAVANAQESYSRFRLLTHTGTRIEGTRALLTSDSLIGQRSDGTAVRLSRSELRALDVSSGSGAGKGAAIGASLGLLTALAALAQVGLDDTRDLNKGAAVGVTVGLTVGGGLLGGAVGGAHPRWRSIPLRTASTGLSEVCCMVRLIDIRF